MEVNNANSLLKKIPTSAEFQKVTFFVDTLVGNLHQRELKSCSGLVVAVTCGFHVESLLDTEETSAPLTHSQLQ